MSLATDLILAGDKTDVATLVAYAQHLEDKVARLCSALHDARAQLSALGGTSGVHMSDRDAEECGCDMIQRAVIQQIDEALKD